MDRSTWLRVVAFAHVGLNVAHGSSAVFIFSRFAWDYLVSSVIGSAWRVGGENSEDAATGWEKEATRCGVKPEKKTSCYSFTAGSLPSVLIPSVALSASDP